MMLYPIFTNLSAFKLEPPALLLSRNLAMRFAACWMAFVAVSGCSTSGAIAPTSMSPRLAGGLPVSLEQAHAYDAATPGTAIPLPTGTSQAVAVIDGGDGQLIGGAAPKGKTNSPDGNVVLNLSSVPLQQAAKTVLGDMIGVN
jgi:general secretion pathway protein D